MRISERSPIFDIRINRRAFLGSAALAIADVALKAKDGIVIGSVNDPPIHIERDEVEELRAIRNMTRSSVIVSQEGENSTIKEDSALTHEIITVAHGAGDSIESLSDAANKGIDYAELDGNKLDRIYADHKLFFGLDNDHIILGGVGIDPFQLKLGRPNLPLEEVFSKAGDVNIGLFIELKRGRFTKEDIEHIRSWSVQYKTDSILHSEHFEELDMAMGVFESHSQASGEKLDTSKFVYVVKTADDLNRVISNPQRKTVLSTARLALEQKHMMQNHAIKAFVGQIEDVANALELYDLGLLQGIFDSTTNLSRLFPKTSTT